MKNELSRSKFALISIVASLLLSSCGGSGGSAPGGEFPEWLVPIAGLADGGPGQDGIPAIENPIFESAATITTVDPDDLVIVLRDGAQVKAYPHDIMDYHEIVNDGPIDDPFIMSYCPLTGSAVAWLGSKTDSDPTYGVSGILFNSNLLLYDRASQTVWSQLYQIGVNGPRIRARPAGKRLFETTFETLKTMYPDALVMTRETGHVRGYDDYPYGAYKTEPGLLFTVSRQDNRLHPKQRVIGITEGVGEASSAKTYQIGAFGASTQVINDQFNNQSIVIVGNSSLSFAAIYSRVLSDGTILTFSPVISDLPNVMSDDEGNVWDIFGTAVSGPRAGQELGATQSFVAMWFAWVSHFQDVQINFN